MTKAKKLIEDIEYSIKTGGAGDKIVSEVREKQVKIERKEKKEGKSKRKKERKSRAKTFSKKGIDEAAPKILRKPASKFKKGVQKFYGKKKDGKKGIKRREKATRGVLTAMGVIKGKQTSAGAGRPRGSYKHGVPIAVYKRNLRERAAQYQKYQQEQFSRLKRKGFTPEQVQALQQQKTLQELEQGSQAPQQPQQRQQSQPIRIVRPGYRKMRVPTNMHNRLIQPGPSVADEELQFRKWSSESTITPRTQRLLDQIRRIQNKGKRDNIEQQRILRERNMVGRSMNLMKAHENMINTDMDVTGVNNENILMAPSVFRENPDNNILRNNRGGMSILNTRDAGNDLHF